MPGRTKGHSGKAGVSVLTKWTGQGGCVLHVKLQLNRVDDEERAKIISALHQRGDSVQPGAKTLTAKINGHELLSPRRQTELLHDLLSDIRAALRAPSRSRSAAMPRQRHPHGAKAPRSTHLIGFPQQGFGRRSQIRFV